MKKVIRSSSSNTTVSNTVLKLKEYHFKKFPILIQQESQKLEITS